MSEGYSDREPSSSEGLVMLRDAAATGDLQAFEKVLGGLVAARMSFWKHFFQIAEVRAAMCDNYNGIIRVANTIINDPNSSAEDVNWAKGKRDQAIAGKAEQGCPITVS